MNSGKKSFRKIIIVFIIFPFIENVHCDDLDVLGAREINNSNDEAMGSKTIEHVHDAYLEVPETGSVGKHVRILPRHLQLTVLLIVG